jgi:hypothetical protein
MEGVACSFIFSSIHASFTGEDEDTAAFRCQAGVSAITASETEQGGEGEEGEGTEGVGDDGMSDAQRDAQLLFFAPAAVGCWVVGEDNAAYEKVFCCQAVVFCAPLDSDAVEVEGGERGERGRMGVRMRIVIEGEVGERGGEEGGEKEEEEREGESVRMRVAVAVASSRAERRWRWSGEVGDVRLRRRTSRWMMRGSEGEV